MTSSVDVIVTPTTPGFEHNEGLAGEIARQAGEDLLHDCAQLLREYGELESGMALFTGAGRLSYRAIIHAIAPVMGEGDEQRKLELAISRSLQLCEMNEWRSVAFPAFADAKSSLPVQLCAEALLRAITRFWDARHESILRTVTVCLASEQYRLFCDIMDGQGVASQEGLPAAQADAEEKIGYIDLPEEGAASPDDEIDSWFR